MISTTSSRKLSNKIKDHKMLDKKTYENSTEKFKKMADKVQTDPMLLKYHIYPEAGWLNDPNGLCQFKGNFHIYFQYSPLDENRKEIIWGHVSSPDFIHFKRDNPFLYADSPLDKDGAYSGSAFIKDDEINYFYTGNVKYDGDFDYINDGREHNTIKVKSRDAVNYDEKELILTNSDYPLDITKHVRDPKIYEKNGIYYMFLGARSKEDKGMVLVFKSADLENFTYHMRIESNDKFGYMWECPDFFELNGKDLLIVCPQGLQKEDYKYQNIYQAGYFPIEIDLENKEYRLGKFKELDYGFDFYAPQTFQDESDRRILLGWMGMPDAEYTNPTTKYKWQHCLTIPRELTYINGKICQRPIKELKKLRQENEYLPRGEKLEISVFEALCSKIASEFKVKLRGDVTLTYNNQTLILNMGESSWGRKIRQVRIEEIENIRIFSDKSSLEIFINDGSYTLSTRVYSKNMNFSSDDLDFEVYRLNPIKFM